MGYIETLGYGTRKARKEHVCWHCGRPIERGTEYSYGTHKYDDVYTLKYHQECYDAALWHIKIADYYPDGDGFPPLWQMIQDGDAQLDIDFMRGHFPHVACRLEFRENKRDSNE